MSIDFLNFTATAMQNVFNTNSREVLRIARPMIDDIASDLAGKIVEESLSAFTKEELIPLA